MGDNVEVKTEYGRAVCDMLGSQISGLLRLKFLPNEVAMDLLRVKTALMRMRTRTTEVKKEE
jgi:hypothetical protein